LSAAPRGFACRERERPEADRLLEGCPLEKLARRQANIFCRVSRRGSNRARRPSETHAVKFPRRFSCFSRKRLRIDYSRGFFATSQCVTFHFHSSTRWSVHVSCSIERTSSAHKRAKNRRLYNSRINRVTAGGLVTRLGSVKRRNISPLAGLRASLKCAS